MPTYEYACRHCGEHLEVVQSFSDDALTECPACGGSLRKVFGSVGIVFKGSGFYKTDSRSTTTAVKPAAEAAHSDGAGSSGTDSPATPASGSDSSAPASPSAPASGGSTAGSVGATAP